MEWYWHSALSAGPGTLQEGRLLSNEAVFGTGEGEWSGYVGECWYITGMGET